MRIHASKRGNGYVLTYTGIYKSNHVLNTYTWYTYTWLTLVSTLSVISPLNFSLLFKSIL